MSTETGFQRITAKRIGSHKRDKFQTPTRRSVGVTLALLALLSIKAPTAEAADANYSPHVGVAYPTQVLWGDTHLHTSNSFDARAVGGTLEVDGAYRFARGDEVISATGQAIRLARPLDFLVITDHSDLMGSIDELLKGNKIFMANSQLRKAREKLLSGGPNVGMTLLGLISAVEGDTNNPLINESVTRSVWDDYIKTADRYNEPGRFTAMIGYEWTPSKGGGNDHRNVLYRDGADFAKQLLPFTAAQSVNPEDLWAWMQRYEDETGGQVLALAHNANISNGTMFPVEANHATGKKLTPDYVEKRIRWEPIYEVTQMKGDGEAHPYLSPDDEFADFENWDRGNTTLLEPKKPEMLQYEYAREALKNGLVLQRKLGTNPYQFGMLGSTDSHTSLATAAEDNYFGNLSNLEPSAKRTSEPLIRLVGLPNAWQVWETSASGYAGVWANENTREAIFDAMKRREVYATTGPRMTVRFFGGFSFESADASSNNLVPIGYQKGVPMGGVISSPDKKQAPTFLIAAMKDPFSANLDRIQVVKGWLDDKGRTHEKIYNVVWGDAHRRKLSRKGKLPPVGNTVDIKNASWRDTIGDAQLSTFWSDPDFDPAQPSFYYLRVLEIPTPRWPVYDAKRYGVELPKNAKTIIQERAYSSPIWYNPE